MLYFFHAFRIPTNQWGCAGAFLKNLRQNILLWKKKTAHLLFLFGIATRLHALRIQPRPVSWCDQIVVELGYSEKRTCGLTLVPGLKVHHSMVCGDYVFGHIDCFPFEYCKCLVCRWPWTIIILCAWMGIPPVDVRFLFLVVR